MEKLSAPLVVVISAFLYFTHDAGFKFEEAPADKRVAFVERQAFRTVAGAKFVMLGGSDAVIVSPDQMNARVKLSADATPFQQRRRQDVFKETCGSYLSSYLDEHGITLAFEFYRDTGAMAGNMTFSPRSCAAYANKDD